THWKTPNYDWILSADWLVFPAIALVIAWVFVSAWMCARLRGFGMTDAHRHAALFGLLLIGLETVFLTMELSGFWLLQISFYVSSLIPNAFICLGAAIAFGTSRTSRRWDVVIVAATAASMLVPFLIAARHLSCCPQRSEIAGPLGLLAGAGCLLLA